jgi:hypothetical protein
MQRSRSQLPQKKTRTREEEEITKRSTLFRVYLRRKKRSAKSQEHENWILFLSQNRSREDEKRERSSALDLHGIEEGSKSKRECARKRASTNGSFRRNERLAQMRLHGLCEDN